MIGIDTNVLARYILQDDPKQTKIASEFIEKKCSEKNPGFINGIVLCELVWVFESAYEYSRKEIAKVLAQILRTRQFYIYQADILWQALHDYSQGNADFADSYIACLNVSNGCKNTITFDKKAARLKQVNLLT